MKEMKILLVSSCYRNWIRSRLMGHLARMQTLPVPSSIIDVVIWKSGLSIHKELIFLQLERNQRRTNSCRIMAFTVKVSRLI